MDVLRSTMVEAAFRPANEEPRSLLDFVDEQGVETMRDALKDSIRESKVHYPHNVSSFFLTWFLGGTDRIRLLYTLFRR
jgi:hypothetical protein